MNPKKIAEYLGVSLGLCGALFVIHKSVSYYDDLETPLNLTVFDWFLLIGLVVAFAGMNVFLAYGWYRICKATKLTIGFPSAASVYAQSQLAKYVPGNVFQFVGRQALTTAKGYPNVLVAKTTFFELIILAITGSFFLIPVGCLQITNMPLSIVSGLFIGLIIATFILLKVTTSFQWTQAFISYFIFLTGTGLIFLFTLQIFSDTSVQPDEIGVIIASYVVAWLSGLLTPGAPAGVGVREAVLLILLRDVAPESVVLITVLIGRFINILADIIFFIAGFFISRSIQTL